MIFCNLLEYMKRYVYVFAAIITLTFAACNSSGGKQTSSADATSAPSFDASKELVYYNDAHLQLVKEKIQTNDPYFTAQYKEVLEEGNAALSYTADPVTNKTQIPPSKDMHDYLSYAPYRWPDPSKADGLPWIARDGIINPVSRDNDTDFNRKDQFFDAIGKLTWTYYFSGDNKYAEKAIDLIKVWYLDPETRVNPNINFGQGVPGVADGRKAGVHEWGNQSNVITALQMFEFDGVLPEDIKTGMKSWLSEYLNWLTTDTMAISAGFTRQNHANHYNYQVVGLMMYLGKNEEAKAVVEEAKKSRIEDQILPDGSQPREMGRTKSVHYATLNLWSMTELTLMGRKLGVDLWAYETQDGRSLKNAYAYLANFVLNPEAWPERQITEGGAQKAIEQNLTPLFSKASTVLGTALIDPQVKAYLKLKPLDALRYPPVEMLPEISK